MNCTNECLSLSPPLCVCVTNQRSCSHLHSVIVHNSLAYTFESCILLFSRRWCIIIIIYVIRLRWQKRRIQIWIFKWTRVEDASIKCVNLKLHPWVNQLHFNDYTFNATQSVASAATTMEFVCNNAMVKCIPQLMEISHSRIPSMRTCALIKNLNPNHRSNDE